MSSHTVHSQLTITNKNNKLRSCISIAVPMSSNIPPTKTNRLLSHIVFWQEQRELYHWSLVCSWGNAEGDNPHFDVSSRVHSYHSAWRGASCMQVRMLSILMNKNVVNPEVSSWVLTLSQSLYSIDVLIKLSGPKTKAWQKFAHFSSDVLSPCMSRSGSASRGCPIWKCPCVMTSTRHRRHAGRSVLSLPLLHANGSSLIWQ